MAIEKGLLFPRAVWDLKLQILFHECKHSHLKPILMSFLAREFLRYAFDETSCGTKKDGTQCHMSFFFKIIGLGNETGIQPCFSSLVVRDSQFHGQTASLLSFPIWISIGVTQKLQSIIRTLTGVNPK